MILTFSLAFSLLFLLFGGVILHYNISSARDRSYNYCRKIVESNIALIDSYFEQLQNVSRIIANDKDVLEAVAYRNNTAEIDYGIELAHQRNVLDKIKQADVLGIIDSSYIIGNSGRYLYFYGGAPKKEYDFSTAPWFKSATAGGNASIRFTPYHATDYLIGGGPEAVSIVTPIINTTQYVPSGKAYFVCDFRLESILKSESAHKDIQVAIYNGSEPVYFPGELLPEKQRRYAEAALSQGERSFMLTKAQGAPYTLVAASETSKISGWTILGIMPAPEIDALLVDNTLFVGVLILLSVGIVVLLSGVLSRSILVPMNMLVSNFNRIARGESVAFTLTKSAEVNSLSDTAQHMLASIERLSREAIKNQALLAQEQFKVLQHQINPHFFNNTLQSIKALAVGGDTGAISRITTLLGRILSYSVYNPLDRVRLCEELAYIENYIVLYKARYPDITYDIDCPAGLGETRVPKLIIQPIVENSIEHGFTGMKEGHIRICAEEDEGDIHIVVSDNGAGFGPGKLKEIQEQLHSGGEPRGESIGIQNVHRRIQSIYGARYGIRILSEASRNTSVIITIPRESEV